MLKDFGKAHVIIEGWVLYQRVILAPFNWFFRLKEIFKKDVTFSSSFISNLDFFKDNNWCFVQMCIH
jgi:hypothetical protein